MRRRVPTHRPGASTRPRAVPTAEPAGDHSDTAWRRFINGRAWRACSRNYLAKHPACVRCLQKGDLAQATQTHHTRGQDLESAFDESTFEALCGPCHSRQTRADQNRRHTAPQPRDAPP